MRILLVAYEYPPSSSPQSLRWYYLSRELKRRGHIVWVLSPDAFDPANGRSLPAPEGVVVHRTFPGPVRSLVRLAAKRAHRTESVDSQTSSAGAMSSPARLNWKGKLLRFVERVTSSFLYPDERGEWYPWMMLRSRGLVRRFRPDVIICSHEPATTLHVGLKFRERGVPFVADLGDPVLAPYTPRRWHRRARKLEAEIVRKAASIIVTSERARSALVERTMVSERQVSVLTQGFDPDVELEEVEWPPDLWGPSLNLFYGGSFYGFRRASELFEAVASVPGVRLVVATSVAPQDLLRFAREYPDRFRVTGFVSHRRALAMQRAADVLINIANDDPVQVPGKLYEYLGARRMILHIAGSLSDAGADLVERTGVGLVVPNDRFAVAEVLARLANQKMVNGRVAHDPEGGSRVRAYSWPALGSALESLLLDAVGRCADREV